MKKITFYFLLVVLLNSISSCKDSEDNVNNINSSPYYEVVNNLSVLKEDGLSFIKDSIKSDSLVVFAGNTPNSIIPQVGSNIYIPVSQKSPYGMLAKVMSVNKGSDISVVTKALPLEEAFEYLSVDTTLSVITELDGVFDKEGKPLDYEIVDTAEMNTDINAQSQHFNNSFIKSRASLKYDWDWKKECLKFPIKLYKGNSGKDKITINGMVYVGFDKFDLDIDVNKFKVNYIKLDATPYVKLAAESVVSTESKVELEDRIGQLRFKVTVPTPIGVPVIVPITLYMYGTCGIKGELSAKLGLQYKYNCNCVATYKNGQWTSKATHGGFNNKSPWIVSEFDVKGEIYSGARIGLLAGLYSATTGIGFNLTPKFSIGAEAKLSSPKLLKANPEVDLNLLVGSDVYCVAEIFGKKLGKYSLKFPDYTLWSTKMYLLPNIENFKAIGTSPTAKISWSHNSLFFLEPLGIKTGTTIYKSDKTTELKSYMPSPTNKNNMGYCTYDVTATGLNAGSTYYAAPFVLWKNIKWYGDVKQIKLSDEPTCGEAIDLGLSVKWASCNWGATSLEETGGYYAFGESFEKEEYTETNYTLMDSYIDLPDEIYLGQTKKWRMPKGEEIMELYEKCTREIVYYKGMKGTLFKGPNGNSIFLPAAGLKDGKDLRYYNESGYYWSSTTIGLYYPAGYGYFSSSFNPFQGSGPRTAVIGRTIRPVCK